MSRSEKADLWRKRLEQWKDSGKSGPVWAAEMGIAYPTFCYWRGKLLSEQVDKQAFVELMEKTKVCSGLLLEWQGISVHLADDFQMATLKRFLQALAELQC